MSEPIANICDSETDSIECITSVDRINSGTKKRKREISSREKQKKFRYSDPYTEKFSWNEPRCDHGPNSVFGCNKISYSDVMNYRKNLFKSPDKIMQDKYILLYILISPPQRRRISEIDAKRDRTLTTSFYLPSFDTKQKIKVCRSVFQSAIKPIGYTRVTGILKRHFTTQSLPQENRGGDRILHKNDSKKDAVREFIKSLKARESHYSAAKSVRIYLPSELKSVKNLHRIFNNSVEGTLKANFSMFYDIFRKEFNIGFNTPRSDVCTTCENLKNNIKTASDLSVSNDYKRKFKMHKLLASEFYEFIRTKTQAKSNHVLIFDLQQVQVLPKIPIQEAYYSRQLGLYNLGVCDVSNGKNYIFTWTENQSERGPNEVSSALYHYLEYVFTKNKNSDDVKTIVFASDGCGGQNKNNILLTMVQSWLFKAPRQIEEIILLFPVRGHSFLPCDRLFGRISNDLKKKDTIITPEEYHEVTHRHASLFVYPTDWEVYDWKSRYKSLYKALPAIQSAKRIIIKKEVRKQKKIITVRKEVTYDTNQQEYISLLKKKTTHSGSKPKVTCSSRPITSAKLSDIKNLLLKTFGEGYEENDRFKFYKQLYTSNSALDDADVCEECQCDAEEENGN